MECAVREVLRVERAWWCLAAFSSCHADVAFVCAQFSANLLISVLIGRACKVFGKNLEAGVVAAGAEECATYDSGGDGARCDAVCA